MIVLDTHAWIWWVTLSELLSEGARGAIDRAGTLGVSAASCWEVGLLSTRGRITLDRDVADWVRHALSLPGVAAMPLGPEVAVNAALLEHEGFPRDPADRMIYATARSNGATLITKDRQIREFDPRGTLW